MTKDELKTVIFEKIDAESASKIALMKEQVELAVGLVLRLRAKDGCPWDREQTHQSLRQYLIEEAYEVLDQLDQMPQQPSREPSALLVEKKLEEELGDLLLQILLHSQLTAERGDFTFGDVCEAMARKLVVRHPHVFKDAKAASSDEVLKNWEKIKQETKSGAAEGLLAGLPKNLPSLQRAARIGEKVKSVGFDWSDYSGALEKVDEEFIELKEAIGGKNKTEIENELGDLFFALCNLSRHLKITPEDAHRKAISKFENRFSQVEKICRERGIDMSKSNLESLDEVWNEVKKNER